MRDIRSDIKERLDAAIEERERINKRLQDLQDQEESLRDLLEAENERWHSREPSLFPTVRHRERRVLLEPPVAQFLLDTMADGTAWSLARLKNHAEKGGVLLGNVAPGRVLHGGLLGLKKRGLVEIVESGVWRLKKADTPSDSTNGASNPAEVA